MLNDTTPPAAFVIDDDVMRKLRALQDELHAGTDRERDYGHRLWLVLNSALPLSTSEVEQLAQLP